MSTWDPPPPPQPELPAPALAPPPSATDVPHGPAGKPRRGLKRRFWKVPLWGWLAGFIGLLVAAGVFVPNETEPDDSQQVAATVSGSKTPPSTVPIVPQVEPLPLTVAPTEPAPTTVLPGSVRALDLLGLVTVENEHQQDYNRDLFGYPGDLDGDGCDTRSEVLIRDSLTPVQIDPNGCTILAGDWLSVYDNTTWTEPGAVQVDHVVSLKEAWDSGAWAWDNARQFAFGNDLEDLRTLNLVTGEVNSAKGEADPSNWLPPDDTQLCTYLADWLAIKVRWSLSMDQSEHGRIGNLLEDRCPGQLVAPAPPPTPNPSTVPPTSPGPVPTAPPTAAPTTTIGIQPVLPPIPSNCDSSYPGVCIPPAPPDLDCGDVGFRRFTVVPPDPHGFDSDSDGIGCESG
jgi:hypothetical protein